MSDPSTVPQGEPSVLDYVKSRLRFWKRGRPLVLPAEPPPTAPSPPTTTAAERPAFPWRSLIAITMALAGQRLFEPPARNGMAGIICYLIAAAFLIWAYARREWNLGDAPPAVLHADPLTMRRLPLILSLVFSLVAFLALGGNRFTSWNVALWIAAIACFVWAVVLRHPEKGRGWASWRELFRRREWQLRLTPWLGLVLLVSAVVIFFRFYHLGGTPAEPFSDHAEKILDVYDITLGATRIFFERNTGREGLQMYLTVLVDRVFGTGLSFMSLKIGTVLCGLAMLPWIYLLGRDLGGRRVGLLAVFLVGIAYWLNVTARIGLRFPLYPLFTAPVLFHLLRGLRNRNRNDFILAGLFLGLGLHGYSPYRIVPVLVIVAVALYLLHRASAGNRRNALIHLSILVLASMLVFLPLLRYALENPIMFGYRAVTRLEYDPAAAQDPWGMVLLSNLWNAARMFNWDNGSIWVHSVTNRPALDVVSAAFFILGMILLGIRYLRRRDWQDLFWIVSIPILQLPSSLSLAFPGENPALNRAGGAAIPVFLIAALAFDGLLTALASRRTRRGLAWGVGILLILWTGVQNYNLVFKQFDQQYRQNSLNSSEMGAVIAQFGQTYGSTDPTWIVPWPYWVDTRLPGIWAGIPNRDFALRREELETSLDVPAPKLFIVKADVDEPAFNDHETLERLEELYPQGSAGLFESSVPNHDFWIFFVP